MSIIFLLILLGLSIYYFFFKNGRYNSLIKKIPGPPTFPLLGHLLHFNVPVEKQWDVIRKLSEEYYPIAKIHLGLQRTLVSLRHPDDLEVLLNSQKFINKGKSYSYFHPWLKTGLLTSSDQKWRSRRKMLTPAFHFNILGKYLEITNENSSKMIKFLREEGEESVQDVVKLCSVFTLNIILEAAMGVDLNKIDKKTADSYRTSVYKLGKVIVYRVARPYIQDWMMNSLWKLGRVQNKALKILHKFISQIIEDRKIIHKSMGDEFKKDFTDDDQVSNSDSINMTKGPKKRLAMLDLLLSAQRDGLIDNEGIEEEVNTFTLEGHDTTAMAITFTLLLLAEHEEIQNTARAEVKEVLDRSGGIIGVSELQELNYLERCIKESLRLFPPVSTITRYASEDLKLKEYLVPAGTEIIYHLYDVHRDPNFWEEPNKFDPDRFLPERIHGRHPYSYIPFSAGPRNCIGQKFAMMELKSLIASIIYNFKLEPIDRIADMKLLLDIVIRPSHPVHTKFIRIDA